MDELYKRYVDVILRQSKEGLITPIRIIWDDGRSYSIDRILSISRHSSQVGGCGIRYVCQIHGRTRNVYLERDRWFIESTHP